jgi:hypothetical protein
MLSRFIGGFASFLAARRRPAREGSRRKLRRLDGIGKAAQVMLPKCSRPVAAMPPRCCGIDAPGNPADLAARRP